MMRKTSLLILLSMGLIHTGWAQDRPVSDDKVMLQLQIHQHAQRLRQQREALETFLIETHVRRSRLDIAQSLQANGFSASDIQSLLAKPAFESLFDRIRNNPVLNKQISAYLDTYLEPHHIEEQVMMMHQEVADRWLELTQAQRMALRMEKQRALRQLRDDTPPAPMSFWQKLKRKWWGDA